MMLPGVIDADQKKNGEHTRDESRDRKADGRLGVLACMAMAAAHGPTRQKVRESIEINAPPAKVWAVIGTFQDMSWLPPVSKTEGDKPSR